MDLILNAEALQSPLTGIGLYTRHLIEELSGFEEVESVRCFIYGRLISGAQCLVLVDNTTHEDNQRQDRRLSLLQAAMNRTTLPYHLYKFRNNRLFRHHTQCSGEHAVYHDPNYILKPFKGPAVITVHDLSVMHYPAFHPKARVQHVNRNLTRSLNRADHVITDSDFVRRELLEHFSLPEDKVTAIHLGVSNAFRPINQQQTATVLNRYALEYKNYLLCVATFEPRKNLNRLMDAYGALPDHIRRQYPLVMVGSRGWRSADLAGRMGTGVASGAIRSLGYVPRADLPALYAGARAFVFPSIYEGFGLPVLEAMACGAPVVTSRDSAMAEFAGDAVLQTDPHDADAIRFSLLQVLEDEALNRRLSTAGHERAGAFTWARCGSAHLSVYKSLLTAPR